MDRTVSNTHLIWWEIMLFSKRQTIGLPLFHTMYILFKYVVITVLRVRDSTLLFISETYEGCSGSTFAVFLFLTAVLRAYVTQLNFHLCYICGIKNITLKKQILPLLSFHRSHILHTWSTPILSLLYCWFHTLFVIRSFSFIEKYQNNHFQGSYSLSISYV